MSDELVGSPSGDENSMPAGGLLERMRQQGAELAKGRRLIVALPGWENVDEGRGLWARFVPLSRAMQQRFAWTPDAASQEIDVVAPMIVEACEEILIGNALQRTPLADEPEVRELREGGAGPLRFDVDLGLITGVGGSDDVAVVKRLLVRGGDDLPFFGVWGELLGWSSAVQMESVEVAVGE